MLDTASPARPPDVLTVDPSGIPRELADRPKWVVWRLEPSPARPGAWTKVPYRALDPKRKASATDPSTWSTFDIAYMAYQQHQDLSGIGVVLDGDGLAGLDLDYAIDEDSKGKPWAHELLRLLPGAYVERSPSGHGIRALFRAKLPPGRRKTHHEDGAVELYDTARFLTITGQAVRHVQQLPELGAEVAELHQQVMPGDAGVGEAVETTGSGPAATVAPEDLEILGLMLSSKRGDVLGRVWDGDYRDFLGGDGQPDESGADLSLANALAFYCARDAARIERIMRAGPWRPKWDERRRDTTWLGLTIGKAIAATRDVYRPGRTGPSFDHAEPGGQLDAAPIEPIETPTAIIERLERELAEARALVAAQQTIIRAHNRVEAQLRADVEQLNRRIYADYRLAKCRTLTSSQKDTIRAIARVATGRADHFDNDAPIITGHTLGAEIGKHESTARLAAEAVCGLPGAPVRRVSRYRDDGYGQLTTYELAVRDPAEIVERFVTIAESMDERKPSRPQPPRCPDHPEARTLIVSRHECGECGKILGESRTWGPAACVQNPRMEEEPSGVDAPVVTPVQVARMAGSPVSRPEPVPIRPGVDRERWRCGCGSYERAHRQDGRTYRCDGCGRSGRYTWADPPPATIGARA